MGLTNLDDSEVEDSTMNRRMNVVMSTNQKTERLCFRRGEWSAGLARAKPLERFRGSIHARTKLHQSQPHKP